MSYKSYFDTFRENAASIPPRLLPEESWLISMVKITMNHVSGQNYDAIGTYSSIDEAKTDNLGHLLFIAIQCNGKGAKKILSILNTK